MAKMSDALQWQDQDFTALHAV